MGRCYERDYSLIISSYYTRLSEDIKMENKIKISYVNPKGLKARDCKTKMNFMIFIFIFLCKIVWNKMLYMIFQYGCEPVLILRILMSFEAIMESN